MHSRDRRETKNASVRAFKTAGNSLTSLKLEGTSTEGATFYQPSWTSPVHQVDRKRRNVRFNSKCENRAEKWVCSRIFLWGGKMSGVSKSFQVNLGPVLVPSWWMMRATKAQETLNGYNRSIFYWFRCRKSFFFKLVFVEFLYGTVPPSEGTFYLHFPFFYSEVKKWD